MFRYKAGDKYVATGVHWEVLDFPAAITCGADLAETRKLLASALIEVAEAAIESGQSVPIPDPSVFDPEMDLEEPIYLHLMASTEVREVPSGVLA